jgi:hypothetical protein
VEFVVVFVAVFVVVVLEVVVVVAVIVVITVVVVLVTNHKLWSALCVYFLCISITYFIVLFIHSILFVSYVQFN